MALGGVLNYCSVMLALLVVLLSLGPTETQGQAATKCHKSDKILHIKGDIDGAATKAPASDGCTGLDGGKGCFKLYPDFTKTKHVKLGFGCGECTGTDKNSKPARDLLAKDAHLKCGQCTLAEDNCNVPTASNKINGYTEKIADFKETDKYQACPHYEDAYKADKKYTNEIIYCKRETLIPDTCGSAVYLDGGKTSVYIGCFFDCNKTVSSKTVNKKGDKAECKKCDETSSAEKCSPDDTKLDKEGEKQNTGEASGTTVPTTTPSPSTPKPTTSGAADAGTGLHSVVLFLPLTAAAALALVPRL